jgi:hypothetical protein
MDEVVDACQRLAVQQSWYAAPDTSGVRPIAAAAPVAEAPARPVERPRISERAPAPRVPSGVANVFREIVAMLISPFTKIFSKLTPVKIGIGIAVLVIAAVGYLLLRSNAVSGEITIQVASSKGAPLSGASVVIEPVPGGAGEPSVKFTDVVTDVSMKGKLEAKTSSAGTLKLKYAVTPETKFAVRVSAPECLERADSLFIRGDTTYSLAYTLAPKPVAGPMVVIVHDKARNPLGSVIVRISGNSGKEYTITTDTRGKANLEINPATEGNSPEVTLSAPSLGTDFAQSSPRKEQLSSSGMNIDINDFFPFDKSMDNCIKEAEGFLRNKDWEKARIPLLKAVTMRPGQGSARAYTYLAQAWWEDDKDNYRQTVEAAKKAIADEEKLSGSDRNSLIEKMYYYEVKGLYQAWRDNKTASNKQEALSASRRYLAMMKGPRFASAIKTNKIFDKHNDDVKDIYDDLK